MAHTLFYKSNKDLSQPHPYIHAPPSSWTNSPSLQVPDVFLIAPEEENVPPWLLFDAAKDSKCDLSRTPDLDFLDVALDALRRADRSPPIVRPDSRDDAGERLVMSRRGVSHPGQGPIVEEEIPWPGIQGMESEGDSVVVEVVKVRKADGLQGPGESGRTMKRSRTFKAAASKAFQSIKNVAKGSNRKPLARDIWSSSGESSHGPRISKDEEQPQAWPRPSTPTMSRRSSFTFTQLFHAPSKKSHPSSDTPEHYLSSSVFPSEPIFSIAPSSDPVPPVRRTELNSSPEIRDDDLQLRTRPLSPSPSTKSSFRRRFSMLELHRVFSSSKSSESQETSSTPVLSCDGSTNSSAPSTSTEASFEMPGTPDEAYASTPFPILRVEKSGVRGQRSEGDIAEPEFGGNVSLEMKLESLHFDSLSFDPDAF